MKEEDFYNEGTWAGQPNYECKQCPYKNLDKSKVLEHVARRHVPPPEPEKPTGVVLLDQLPEKSPEKKAPVLKELIVEEGKPAKKKTSKPKEKEVKKDGSNTTDTD